ncbi:MAG: M61 family metallopeptidase [Vicinamibacteria bacterium]
MNPLRNRGVWLSLLVLASPATLRAESRPIILDVDAREAPRRLFHGRLSIPASPGPLTLVYPKWIPGEHMPSGPIADLAGLKITAGGKSIAWKRDPEEMFAFHLDVPAGADTVEVALDYLSPVEGGAFSAGPTATAELAVVSWNTLALSPQGKGTDELTFKASLRLPQGWKFGTALPVAAETPERIDFVPVSFTTLVDSPVLAGAHFKTVELTGDAIPHRVSIGADSDAALAASPALVDGWKRLVAETGALFRARHYRSYDFLLTLSDHTAHFGLEHHESSDDRVPERSLVDDDARRLLAGLLPHEMTHSWNGKYRRPAGLQPGSFERPMHGELLWVYEGLTEYLGQILTARSGLLTPEEYRESLALTAATMRDQGGREWRPLVDTAVAAQDLYDSRPDWAALRRGVDFYPESELLWLEADSVIRRETKGAKSLDDFCRLFHGGESGAPKVVPYTFDDVVAGLNAVTPYDWRGFWRDRVEAPATNPLGGLGASGWKLVFTDAIPQMQRSFEARRKVVDVRFSLGFVVAEDGRIPDVLPNSPAFRAGVGPGMKLVAANGRKFCRETLRDAIRETRAAKAVDLLVENGEFFKTYHLEYDGGERYPRLEAESGQLDLLSSIIRPLAQPPSPPKPAAKPRP